MVATGKTSELSAEQVGSIWQCDLRWEGRAGIRWSQSAHDEAAFARCAQLTRPPPSHQE